MTIPAVSITCDSCGRTLHVGDSAWARDVKVVLPDRIAVITRHTCDRCEVES